MTTIQTMQMGHIVNCKIVEDDEDGCFIAEFISHWRSGAVSLCLDVGEQWYITAGEKFYTQQINIDRATELMGEE